MSSASGRKRPDAGLDTSNIIEGPRKRARESTAAANHFEQSNSKSPSPAPTPQPKKLTLKLKKQAGGSSMVGGEGKNQVVFEQGMKIWNAVKHAKDPSGRPLAPDFLELPSKKSWPDYYVIIQHPISLKEIKNKLDNGDYPTTRAVKADFDTMWNNAKQYNVPGSGIWIDADNLHKLVQKEFTAVTGEPADMEVDQPAPAEDRAESSVSKAPKTRPPALGKLLKMRLQKLYKMTDDEGRELCGVFMDPPSRRAYPSYYTIIKKLMTFNMIEKKIDRKEYESSQQFMNDVELIWSNAYTFNEEHSPVWEDAKEAFRTLVSDLPAPYTLPPFEDSKATAPPPKIKLKVKDQRAPSTDSGAPAATSPNQEQAKAASPPQPVPTPNAAPSALPSVVPPQGAGTPGPAPSPALPTPPMAPTAASTPGPTYPPAGTPYGNPAQMPAQYPGYPYYPNAYQQAFSPFQPPPPPPTAQTQAAPQPPQPAATTTTNQPTAPVASSKKPPQVKHIRGLTIKTVPAGRRMRFEDVEGLNLRMWSLRLGGGETSVELVDLEVYEKPIIPKQLRKTEKKGKGKGKADDSMDVDEGDDDEDASGEDEASAGGNKPADGEKEVDIEVKLNNFPITSSAAPTPSTPQTAAVETPANPNGALVNGNGHSVDAQSESELSDAEDTPKTRSAGKSKGKASPVKGSKTRKGGKSGSKGSKADLDSQAVKTRMEQKCWVAILKEGQNTLDVKVGSEHSETWRIFVDRVV
ncbi:Methionine aminopeptidase 2 [Tulasnella sp. 408]|nr:Methionine aminopeptidase 2 [Tulasnella sp. 408]